MVRSIPVPAERTSFWDRDLGYPHAVVVVATALLTGLGFHFTLGYGGVGVRAILPMAGAALGFLLVLGRVARKNRVVHWLTGIPFAVVSTTAVGILALIGGVLPEAAIQRQFGAPSVWASWPFLMAMLLMMANLVGSIGKRALPLTYANVLYLLSHAGLAISIGGGAVSALALERNVAVLYEGRPTKVAYDAQEREIPLPFTLTLRKFEMDTFPPTLAVVTLNPKAPKGMDVAPGSRFVEPGMKENIQGHKVEVLEYLPKAVLAGETWRTVPWKSAAPAAKVRVTGPDGKAKVDWVSSGSVETSSAMIPLGENAALVMPEPRPKRFRSLVEITENGAKREVGIEVNQKATVAGYDLYQLSYDEKLGAASPYSVIEVVRDRGIPVVYLGMVLMSLGAILHLWNGVGAKK
jgi:hypothetical protein